MKSLTQEVCSLAESNGADLTGFAPVERFRYAPKMHHPESFLRGAKSVIVVGVHYPDSCVELYGNDYPQEMRAYVIVQAEMNVRLDMLSFKIAKLLVKKGDKILWIKVKGYPWWKETRFTDKDLLKKFKICTEGVLNRKRVEQIIDRITHLEKITNISELTKLLK